MHDEADGVFERALEATKTEPRIPEGFAESVVARVHSRTEPAPRLRPMRRLGAAAALALCALGAAGLLLTRSATGTVEHAAAEARPLEVALGARAVAVLEPGSSLRYAVGDVLSSSPDTVWLDRGELFLRVEPGRAFEVRSAAGVVRVTGTCFRVALASDEEESEEMSEVHTGRARFFGLGALSAAMVVMVYEGGVAISQDGGPETSVAAGEAVAVHADGTVRPLDAQDTELVDAASRPRAGDVAPSAPRAPGSSESQARALGLAAEVTRLRELLTQYAISPESGERIAGARRGIDDDGNTDLTQDEWRILAERGELRFRLPGGHEDHNISDEVSDEHGLAPEDRERLDAIIREAHEALERDMRSLYTEASGLDSAGMAMRAMMIEIEDKTARDIASRIRWTLSQERAGLAVSPPIAAQMLPYERMMRRLVAFESELERAIAAEVGPDLAHALLFGEPSVSAHAYGTRGRP